MGSNGFGRSVMAGIACVAAMVAACARAAPNPSSHGRAESVAQPASPSASQARPKPALDRSGKTRTGQASVYSHRFNGRTMADGTTMDPREDTAASKTLPLGTTARVTNRETGESAVVTIRDRGPYVRGRIVDLSPAAAQKVGIDHRQGVSRVAVTPLSIPASAAMPDPPAAGPSRLQSPARRPEPAARPGP